MTMHAIAKTRSRTKRGIASVVLVFISAGCSAPPRPAVPVTAVTKTEAAIDPGVPPADATPTRVSIATGDARETDFRIGRELAQFVAPDAGITLDVLATKGSTDNLHRLAAERRADLAVVQYDVVQAFVDEAARGDAAAKAIVAPLRIVTPLYTEEMYFIVRKDSPMTTIDDLRDKRINVGVQGSGSALTASNLYRRMFGVAIPSRNIRYLSDDRALAALTIDRSVDVVVVVAAQPAMLFGEMRAQAGNYIKLLALDAGSPGGRAALKVYFPATVRASNYGWLPADVPALSVMSFLVTTDRAAPPGTSGHVARFAKSLCEHLPALQAGGHPKWREVQLGRQLVPRWHYDAASATEFERCGAVRPAARSAIDLIPATPVALYRGVER